jgi:LmbE family N-acetylglucosaminyl deacetylase/uncharacterized membrane protein YbhN (UPF0104 family)
MTGARMRFSLSSVPARLTWLTPRVRAGLVIALYAILFVACATTIAHAIGHDGGIKFSHALSMIGAPDLVRSGLCVIGIYAVMSLMERLALNDARRSEISLRAWPVPLLANSVSTGTGFGALSGGTIRMRLYARWGVDPATSLFVASNVTLMSIAGGLALAALGFVLAPNGIATALGLEPDILRLAGVAILAVFSTALWMAGSQPRLVTIAGLALRIPRATGWATRLGAGALDWVVSAGALYVLLPHDPARSFPAFAATFVAVHLASMVTGAPAGIGVFDALMLGLNPTGVSTEALAAALIAYRLLSFVAPTALGMLGLVLFEARRPPPPHHAVAESAMLPARGQRFARRGTTTRTAHALSQAWTRLLKRPPAARAAHAQQVQSLFRMGERAPPLALADLTAGGPIIVVAPHPDDETLGCGGLLAACAARGVRAQVVVLTDGGRSHFGSRLWPRRRLAAHRAVEARRAMNRLNLPRTAFTAFDFPDGELLFRAGARARAAQRLAMLAKRLRARRIFVTWRHDPHPDHIAAALIAEAAARQLRIPLIEFPVWGRFLPGALRLSDRWRARRLDVRAFLAAKRGAMASYRTQTTPLISDAPLAHRLSPDEWSAFLTPYETYFFSAPP